MNKFISALIMAIVISVCAAGYASNKNEDLKSGLVRLHIVANSDSPEDQEVKLAIRDEILKNVDTNDKYFMEKAEITANEVLKKSGFPYRAQVKTGEFYFPEKEYNGITLPNGEYFGVCVLLGEAKGHNWWCILYPPLCVSGNTVVMNNNKKEILKRTLDSDTYDIISGDNEKVIVKIKTVELVNMIVEKLKNR